MMWVDFRLTHFIGFVYDFLFSNYGENPKNIPTGHKLNQVVK